MPMDNTPEKLGKYRILGVAGKGGMGVVYLGHDPFVDRQVAIKVCRIAGEDHGDRVRARRMFFNEAKSAGALDHPNILRIYDAAELDGQPYIVMEYVAGADTLRNYCRPDRLLPLPRVVSIGLQCARALDYAHRTGVLHRDIKPANIMLTQDGVPKIGDFGIAQRTVGDVTQVLGPFGSPRYMSPEQAQEGAYTAQSDLYSLGVVLYELLVGRPPFMGETLTSLVYKILNEPAPSVARDRPELPKSLALVVHRALQKEPARRFASGRDMAAALETVLAELQQPEPEPSPEQRLAMLRGLRFFAGFPASEVEEVHAEGTWERYESGERIIAEGSEEHAFFVLAAGQVRVLKGDRAIGTLNAGDCFGEMGYLGKTARSASIDALGPVACLKVSSALTEWASLPCQLRLAKAFQRVLIERLAQTSEALAKNAPQRAG